MRWVKTSAAQIGANETSCAHAAPQEGVEEKNPGLRERLVLDLKEFNRVYAPEPLALLQAVAIKHGNSVGKVGDHWLCHSNPCFVDIAGPFFSQVLMNPRDANRSDLPEEVRLLVQYRTCLDNKVIPVFEHFSTCEHEMNRLESLKRLDFLSSFKGLWWL